MLPRVSKREDINSSLCQELVLQLNNLLKSDQSNTAESQVVPFTPISKPNAIKSSEFPTTNTSDMNPS
jgi:hypothetical protein